MQQLNGAAQGEVYERSTGSGRNYRGTNFLSCGGHKVILDSDLAAQNEVRLVEFRETSIGAAFQALSAWDAREC